MFGDQYRESRYWLIDIIGSTDCVKAGLKDVQDKLTAQKNLLKGCNREINEAHGEKTHLTKDLSNAQLQIQELEHKVNKCNKDTNDAAKLVSISAVTAQLVATELIELGVGIVCSVEH